MRITIPKTLIGHAEGAHGAPGQAAKRRNLILRAALLLLFPLAVGVAGWCRWVYVQIETYASQDQAAPADAIGVLARPSTMAGLPQSLAPGSIMPSSSTIAALRRSSSPWAAPAATSSPKALWAANI